MGMFSYLLSFRRRKTATQRMGLFLLDAFAERFNGPASCNCSLGQGRTGPSSWTLTSHLEKTYSLRYYLSQIQMSSTKMCLDISVFAKYNINQRDYYFFR
jgi:hypothetical protein